jgi:hypothetical protein
MVFVLVLAYFIIGGIIFGRVSEFSAKYQQYYTVRSEKQIAFAFILFWPLLTLIWVFSLLWKAILGIFIVIQMMFD